MVVEHFLLLKQHHVFHLVVLRLQPALLKQTLGRLLLLLLLSPKVVSFFWLRLSLPQCWLLQRLWLLFLLNEMAFQIVKLLIALELLFNRLGPFFFNDVHLGTHSPVGRHFGLLGLRGGEAALYWVWRLLPRELLLGRDLGRGALFQPFCVPQSVQGVVC